MPHCAADEFVQRIRIAPCSSEMPQHSLGGDEPDFTGLAVWPASTFLCRFLLSRPGMALIVDKRVVELGAGLGIPGLVAAEFASVTELTDNNMLVVARLADSIALNTARMQGEVSASELAWGLENLPQARRGLADVVIGSDLVYSCQSVALLLDTADALLKPGGVFVLSYISRWLTVDEAFSRHSESHGFTVQFAEWPKGEDDEALLLVLFKCKSHAQRSLDDHDSRSSICRESGVDEHHVVDQTHEDSGLRGVRLASSLTSSLADSTNLISVGRGPLMLKLADVQLLCDTRRQLLRGLRTLNMDRNCLGDAGLQVLCSALSLSQTSSLTNLSLRHNNLGPGSARSLCLITGQPFVRLVLSANCFGKAGAAALAPLIATSALAEFEIASNQIGDDGALEIARAIVSTGQALQKLDLRDDALTSEGIHLVATTLKGCYQLAMLDLSYNLCEAYGADRLAVSGAVWPLKQLCLARCSLRTSGFARIAPFIASMNELELLDLSGNMMNDEGLAEVTEAIAGLTNLTSLSLAMGSVGSDQEVLGDFFEVIATLGRLTSLSLRGHCIDEDAAPVLMRVIPDLKLRLDLSDNPIQCNDEVRSLLQCQCHWQSPARQSETKLDSD